MIRRNQSLNNSSAPKHLHPDRTCGAMAVLSAPSLYAAWCSNASAALKWYVAGFMVDGRVHGRRGVGTTSGPAASQVFGRNLRFRQKVHTFTCWFTHLHAGFTPSITCMNRNAGVASSSANVCPKRAPCLARGKVCVINCSSSTCLQWCGVIRVLTEFMAINCSSSACLQCCGVIRVLTEFMVINVVASSGY